MKNIIKYGGNRNTTFTQNITAIYALTLLVLLNKYMLLQLRTCFSMVTVSHVVRI